MQREFEEIDRRSWEVVAGAFGFSFGGAGAEHLWPWLEPILPWIEGPLLVHDLYKLWEIQEEVSAKYKHCER
jgi:hypothetical protein